METTPHSTLKRQIYLTLRAHYVVNGSAYEDDLLRRHVDTKLDQQIRDYEIGIRYNAIADRQPAPIDRLNERTLHRLFSNDLFELLKAAQLLSDDEEDERIFFDEVDTAIQIFLMSFATEISQRTALTLPVDEQGNVVRLSVNQVAELASALAA